MTVSKEWLDMALSAWTVEAARDTTGYGGEVLAALTELASRRAADEGAVTVEGWTDELLLGGDPWLVNPECDAMLNVYRVATGTAVYPVTVTIRIRKEKP